jgi:hypothetical protein
MRLSAIISARRWVGVRCERTNHWHLVEAELARGEHPAVASNDHTVLADKHRIDEADSAIEPVICATWSSE